MPAASGTERLIAEVSLPSAMLILERRPEESLIVAMATVLKPAQVDGFRGSGVIR